MHIQRFTFRSCGKVAMFDLTNYNRMPSLWRIGARMV